MELPGCCNRESKARGDWTSLAEAASAHGWDGGWVQEMEITSLYLCSEALKTPLGAGDGGRESWKGHRGIGYTVEERAPSAGHPWGLLDSYC